MLGLAFPDWERKTRIEDQKSSKQLPSLFIISFFHLPVLHRDSQSPRQQSSKREEPEAMNVWEKFAEILVLKDCTFSQCKLPAKPAVPRFNKAQNIFKEHLINRLEVFDNRAREPVNSYVFITPKKLPTWSKWKFSEPVRGRSQWLTGKGKQCTCREAILAYLPGHLWLSPPP